MRTHTKILIIFALIFFGLGCTVKIYHRSFWDEEMPEYKQDSGGYYIFDEFAVFPVCSVKSYSREPIVDSAFKIILNVLPTDTSAEGNKRFIQGFGVDSVLIVETENGDTVGVLVNCPDTVQNWSSYSRKPLHCGKIIIPKRIERATLAAKVHYLDQSYVRREQWISFKIYRYDGMKRVIKYHD